MNYVVTVNGERYEVEVERVGGASSSLSRRPPERVSRPVQAAPAAQPAAPGLPSLRHRLLHHQVPAIPS